MPYNNEQVQTKYDKIRRGVGVWASYYRAN